MPFSTERECQTLEKSIYSVEGGSYPEGSPLWGPFDVSDGCVCI